MASTPSLSMAARPTPPGLQRSNSEMILQMSLEEVRALCEERGIDTKGMSTKSKMLSALNKQGQPKKKKSNASFSGTAPKKTKNALLSNKKNKDPPPPPPKRSSGAKVTAVSPKRSSNTTKTPMSASDNGASLRRTNTNPDDAYKNNRMASIEPPPKKASNNFASLQDLNDLDASDPAQKAIQDRLEQYRKKREAKAAKDKPANAPAKNNTSSAPPPPPPSASEEKASTPKNSGNNQDMDDSQQQQIIQDRLEEYRRKKAAKDKQNKPTATTSSPKNTPPASKDPSLSSVTSKVSKDPSLSSIRDPSLSSIGSKSPKRSTAKVVSVSPKATPKSTPAWAQKRASANSPKASPMASPAWSPKRASTGTKSPPRSQSTNNAWGKSASEGGTNGLRRTYTNSPKNSPKQEPNEAQKAIQDRLEQYRKKREAKEKLAAEKAKLQDEQPPQDVVRQSSFPKFGRTDTNSSASSAGSNESETQKAIQDRLDQYRKKREAKERLAAEEARLAQEEDPGEEAPDSRISLAPEDLPDLHSRDSTSSMPNDSNHSFMTANMDMSEGNLDDDSDMFHSARRGPSGVGWDVPSSIPEMAEDKTIPPLQQIGEDTIPALQESDDSSEQLHNSMSGRRGRARRGGGTNFQAPAAEPVVPKLKKMDGPGGLRRMGTDASGNAQVRRATLNANQAKKNYYNILGVPRCSTLDDIHKAFEKMEQQYKGVDEETYQAVSQAYAILSNDEMRELYHEGDLDANGKVKKSSFHKVKNFYNVLGVSKDASANDIQKAYTELCKEVHPSNGGDPAIFDKVAKAFEILSDPEMRRHFDAGELDEDGILNEAALIKSSNNYYDILGVPKNASPEEIEAAYHGLHSEYEGDPEILQALAKAYSILSDQEMRQHFDNGDLDQDGSIKKSALHKSSNYYQVLGVPQNASKATIEKAFQNLSQEVHPDNGGDPKSYEAVVRARDILTDDSMRQRFDRGELNKDGSIKGEVLAAEAAARKAEEEAAARVAEAKKAEEEAAARIAEAKRLEEQAATARKAEEEAAAKRAEEEAAARIAAARKAEEEAMARIAEAKRMEEEFAAARKVEEEAAAKRAEEEAAARIAEAKRAEEEAMARIAEAKRVEEEAAARIAEAKRVEQVAAARKAEEEAAARIAAAKRAEEEAMARIAEAKRAEEEAAAKIAEEEAAAKRAEEEARAKVAEAKRVEEEAAVRRAEEKARKVEAAAKKAKQEEAGKKAKEEAAAAKRVEEEAQAARKAEQQKIAAKKAEEEAKAAKKAKDTATAKKKTEVAAAKKAQEKKAAEEKFAEEAKAMFPPEEQERIDEILKAMKNKPQKPKTRKPKSSGEPRKKGPPPPWFNKGGSKAGGAAPGGKRRSYQWEGDTSWMDEAGAWANQNSLNYEEMDLETAYALAPKHKWKTTTDKHNGMLGFMKIGKQKEYKGKGIKKAIEKFKGNPHLYAGLSFQTAAQSYSKKDQKYMLISRAGTDRLTANGQTGDKKQDIHTLMIHNFIQLRPYPDNKLPECDEYTSRMTYQGKKLPPPLLPGRGMGIADNPLLKVIGDIDPSDVSQGQVGNCWLLSAISSVAEFDGGIKKLFRKSGQYLDYMPFADGQVNFYTITLWDLTTWKEVDYRIDESLCASPENPNQLLGSKPSDDGELWVPYLEKALAIHCGGWDEIVGGQCTHAWAILTGCKAQYTFMRNKETGLWMCLGKFNTKTGESQPHFNSPHDGPGSAQFQVPWPNVGGGGEAGEQITDEELYLKMAAWDEQNYIVAAGTKHNAKQMPKGGGMVEGHAYSVIDAHPKVAGTDIDLLWLRNPWGSGEIEDGDFDDDGPGWGEYPEIKEELQPVDADDGLFYVTKEEFFMLFDHIYLSASDMTAFKED